MKNNKVTRRLFTEVPQSEREEIKQKRESGAKLNILCFEHKFTMDILTKILKS